MKQIARKLCIQHNSEFFTNSVSSPLTQQSGKLNQIKQEPRILETVSDFIFRLKTVIDQWYVAE